MLKDAWTGQFGTKMCRHSGSESIKKFWSFLENISGGKNPMWRKYLNYNCL